MKFLKLVVILSYLIDATTTIFLSNFRNKFEKIKKILTNLFKKNIFVYPILKRYVRFLQLLKYPIVPKYHKITFLFCLQINNQNNF